MSHLQQLLSEIHELEKRVSDEIGREAEKIGFTIHHGRVQFEEEVARRHQGMAMGLRRYLKESAWPVLFTAPLAYSLLLPLLALDLFATLYQRVCFPVYGIPRVKRGDYILYDRQRLRYLNPIERLHCAYCGYGNGLLAYATEVAARTEQYWCPIKHAARIRSPHSRYHKFIPYGEAEDYAKRLEELRKSFEDC